MGIMSNDFNYKRVQRGIFLSMSFRQRCLVVEALAGLLPSSQRAGRKPAGLPRSYSSVALDASSGR